MTPWLCHPSSLVKLPHGKWSKGMWPLIFALQDSPPLGGKAVNGSSCEGVSGHCTLDIPGFPHSSDIGIRHSTDPSSGYAVPYQAFRICLGGAVKETTRRDGRLFETWTSWRENPFLDASCRVVFVSLLELSCSWAILAKTGNIPQYHIMMSCTLMSCKVLYFSVSQPTLFWMSLHVVVEWCWGVFRASPNRDDCSWTDN